MFMDSLYSCFFAHMSLTDCYGMCIHWSFLQEETYTGEVTISFLTEWMPFLFSMEFSEGKPIRTLHLENQSLDGFCL